MQRKCIKISNMEGATMIQTKSRTHSLILRALFAALIAVGAFIRIPIPVVPFTLQYLFTMLAGLLLGSKQGAASVLVYTLVGLTGFPIFTEGGGLSYILKPSFGYIIGFIVGAYVTGAIANAVPFPSYRRTLTANVAGLGIVYLFGMVYYYMISHLYLGTGIGLWPLFLYCFILAVPGDILLCILASVVAKPLSRALNSKHT